ncbi:MAG: MerR family transcriptional regulator [Deltaproteobacteria bacterium]
MKFEPTTTSEIVEEPLFEIGEIVGSPISKLPNKFFFRIGEVAKFVGVAPCVIRYWEAEFNIVKPSRSRGKHRIYRKKDIENLLQIRSYLYEENFTVEGAKKQFTKRKIETSISGNPQTTLKTNILKNIINDLEEIKTLLTR